MSKFLTHLEGRWEDDDERFVILKDLVYQSDLLGATIRVPAGFVTDFASVPRVPVAYWLFGDRAHHESVVHDFLYQTHEVKTTVSGVPGRFEVTRGTADKVFLEAMRSRGKSKFVQYGMYWGVVMGGRSSYKTGPERYQQLNVEKREESPNA